MTAEDLARSKKQAPRVDRRRGHRLDHDEHGGRECYNQKAKKWEERKGWKEMNCEWDLFVSQCMPRMWQVSARSGTISRPTELRIWTGCKQGAPESPILWNILLDEALEPALAK